MYRPYPKSQLSNAIKISMLTGFLVITGCASTPKAPDQALQAAELAIKNAEQARVADYASPELAEARVKLTAARDQVAQKHMVEAERLAQQARADAELAVAKADAVKAKGANDEIKKANETLKIEMNRNTGMPQ